MSCPLAVLRPLLFWATHSYTPASSGRKYGISRTPLEWLILILPGSGFPSALLHEMDGTGLWKSQQKVTDTAREKKLSGCCVNVMEGGHLLSQSKALQPHRGSIPWRREECRGSEPQSSARILPSQLHER